MKKIFLIIITSTALTYAEIDTTSLFLNTEALRAYCEKKCLDDGDCVEKCMMLDQEDHTFS